MAKTEAKNFSICIFSLNLPLVEQKSGNLHISFELTFNYGNKSDVILNNMKLKTIDGGCRNYEIRYLCKSDSINHRVAFDVTNPNSLSYAKLCFCFFSDNDKKYEIVYKTDCIGKKTVLESVGFEQRTKGTFQTLINQGPIKMKPIHPSLAEYKNAVLKETKYLKNFGGKLYKVSNGEFISRIDGRYSYDFDLETELALNEDAQITLHLNNLRVKGTVLACEGFSLVVLLEMSVGQKVSLAYISSSPW